MTQTKDIYAYLPLNSRDECACWVVVLALLLRLTKQLAPFVAEDNSEKSPTEQIVESMIARLVERAA